MKMHGLGNDFVVIDKRQHPWVNITPAMAEAIADRHCGVGFDQLTVISTPVAAEQNTTKAHIRLDFLNADGSTSAACGNATRCIARYEMDRTGASELNIETARGMLFARDIGGGITAINMGAPQLSWDEIPLAEQMDTLILPIEGDPTATNMGNPHCSFFVDDADSVDLAAFGAAHEHHPLFPERTNVQVVQVLSPTRLRMRVWERGVGVTLASGSSSCAVAVAAARRGLAGRKVEIVLDGGILQVEWAQDGVWMQGKTAHVFDGVLTPTFLAGL